MDENNKLGPGPARLDISRALELWQEADLFDLGSRAHARRMALHPDGNVTYVVDRNINYTNVCVSGCKFCAFFRPPGHPEGYVLSFSDLEEKIRETEELGGYQILLQGGMNPDLDLGYYSDLLRFIKDNHPRVWVHGFSPPEIFYLARSSSMGCSEVLKRLIDSGLDSIPGGGAEILADRVRSRVSPNKCTAAEWLEVMRQAHLLGLKTTATMMFGHVEGIEERIEHLQAIRDLQDETGGFTAFIPWTFQPHGTRLSTREASSVEYLRFLALSRLFVDNIPNIQASWVTQGPKIGQLALFWGANDFGSTMIEENVVSSAGVCFKLPEKDMRELIHSAGFTPRRRTMLYEYLKED
ncbi:MAG: cyclic dehypoxanthinyl futalosine synthase [Desulfonatronovibrionaceae bacterium]